MKTVQSSLVHASCRPVAGASSCRRTAAVRFRQAPVQDEARFSERTRPGFFSTKIGDAMEFAMAIHQSQLRKGSSVPYFSHLIGVMSIMLEFAPIQDARNGFVPAPDYLLEVFRRPGQPDVRITLEDAVIAALLHDAIEDQGGRGMRDRIEARFGPVVAMLVDYCTDYGDDPSKTYNERKVAYLERVVNEAPETALLISASDKLHNMRTMLREYRQQGEGFWQRFKPSREEKLQYNRDIVGIYGQSGKFPELMDEIAYTQRQIEALAESNRHPVLRLWRAVAESLN